MPGYNAMQLDAEDELSAYRSRFKISDPSCVYLDGNSLGRMPKAATETMRNVVESQWGGELVRGWEHWFGLPQKLGAKIARIVGAREDEVVVSDSTTVNLFKLVYAAVAENPAKKSIVTDDLNFPSDFYAIASVVAALGEDRKLETVRSRDSITIEDNQLEKPLDSAALLTLSHVSFKSGFLYDMEKVTALAHSRGASVLWDLSHSVGAVPIDLNRCDVDFAVGCTYKYLNGGPGAPAFIYMRRDLQERLNSPIWGWFGRRNAFDFGLDYVPREGIAKFLVGTPPILSLAAIEPGLDMVLEAGLDAIRAKSVLAVEFLVQLWNEHLQPLGVALKSPTEPNRRGSHISFGHPRALEIDQALIHEHNVIPDFRAPDNLRFGISPLYTSFSEIEEGVMRLKSVLENKSYEKFAGHKPNVT